MRAPRMWRMRCVRVGSTPAPVSRCSRDAANTLAVGEFWYRPRNGPTGHAIVVALTPEGRVFLEPQTGQFVILTENEFAGRVVSTDKVTLTTEIPSAVQSLEKASLKDEYMVSPARIRVAPGATVTWTNNGAETHEIVAADGSWTTGPIAPGATGSHTFAAAGKVLYTCKGHPWTYGQVNVEAK